MDEGPWREERGSVQQLASVGRRRLDHRGRSRRRCESDGRLRAWRWGVIPMPTACGACRPDRGRRGRRTAARNVPSVAGTDQRRRLGVDPRRGGQARRVPRSERRARRTRDVSPCAAARSDGGQDAARRAHALRARDVPEPVPPRRRSTRLDALRARYRQPRRARMDAAPDGARSVGGVLARRGHGRSAGRHVRVSRRAPCTAADSTSRSRCSPIMAHEARDASKPRFRPTTLP